MAVYLPSTLMVAVSLATAWIRPVLRRIFVGVLCLACSPISGADDPVTEKPAVQIAGDDEGPVEASQNGVDDSETINLSENTTEKRLRFSFNYAPWKEVLDWLAAQSDSALTLESPPPGTFNYSDSRSYTVPEAVDVINSLLLTKGYTLVRRDRLMLLVNLKDGIPPNLVAQVTPEELDQRGEYEIVSCLFELERMSPEQAEEELGRLLGPQGKMVVLPTSRQIVLTETAGKLRTMREIIRKIENPTEEAGTKITPLNLDHISPEEALIVIRQLMDIPPDEYVNAEGTIRLSADTVGSRLLAKASPQNIAEIRDILKLIDVDLGLEAPTTIATAPQLEVYPIGADPETTLQILQTLLAGMPDVRLQLDPLTNNLVALARPAEHATIRATLAQLESEHDKIEIFDLNVVDPTTARLAVESLFGIKPGDDKEAKPAAPRVDANLATRQLLVRGRPDDVEKIRLLLQKMGEDNSGRFAQDKGNIRMLPFHSGSTSDLLQRAQAIWPTIRGNRVRTVTPSDAVNTILRYKAGGSGGGSGKPIQPPGPSAPPDSAPRGTESPSPVPPEPPAKQPSRTALGSTGDRGTIYLAQAQPESLPLERERPILREDNLSEIIVAPGPGGLLIASDDLQALDEFEELLNALSDPTMFQSNEYTICYLKYARAEEAASLLNNLIKESSGESEGGGGLGGLASMALGGGVGGLLSSAAGAFSLGDSIQIVPDSRINALFVKAPAADVDLIRQLLEVIDLAHSPEKVATTPPPRLIPVFNTSAAEVASVVAQIYVNNEPNKESQKNRQPNVQELLQAMRRGGGGGQQQQSGSASSEPRVTVGVDARSNSLIVSAPDPLFEQIKALVAQLDDVAIQSNETTRVLTLTRANPETVQNALRSLFGGQVQSTTANDANAPNQAGKQPAKKSNNSAETRALQNQIRRRMEFFNAMQRAQRGGRAEGRGGGDRGGQGAGRGGQRGQRGGRGDR